MAKDHGPSVKDDDQYEALRRDGNRTPVLILSARQAVNDRVSGLEIGGDDHPGGWVPQQKISVEEALRAYTIDANDQLRSAEEYRRIIVAYRTDAAGNGAPVFLSDVADVVEVMHAAGIATKVAKLVPLAVVKG